MKDRIFTGSGVAIVTPMHPDGSVNYSVFGELIDFQIQNGTDALIVCGTTGESAALSHEEHVEVLRFAINHTHHRIPVIAGTGSNDTAYAKLLSQEAESLGADALLLVTPYYNKTSQAGIVRHFETIADSVSIPNIIYNVPSRTGLNIKPETYRVLANHPNINAIKEANGNIVEMAETVHLCGNDLNLYSGNDDQIVPVLSLGGIGVISVIANILPKETHQICRLYLEENCKESLHLQLELFPLIKALFADVNPIPVKAALNLMGYACGECRLPLVSLGENHLAMLKQAMEARGLL